jgi:hypothetical protein
VEQAIASIPPAPGLLGLTQSWQPGLLRLQCTYQGPIGAQVQRHAIVLETAVKAAAPGLQVEVDVVGIDPLSVFGRNRPPWG